MKYLVLNMDRRDYSLSVRFKNLCLLLCVVGLIACAPAPKLVAHPVTNGKPMLIEFYADWGSV